MYNDQANRASGSESGGFFGYANFNFIFEVFMSKNMTLMEFLRFLSNCSGDEAIEMISKFQSGAVTVAGVSSDEFD